MILFTVVCNQYIHNDKETVKATGR